MKTIQARDAKASFSALIEAAAQGHPTTITRHGVPVAVIAPSPTRAKSTPRRRRLLSTFCCPFPAARSSSATSDRCGMSTCDKACLLDTSVVSALAPGRPRPSSDAEAWLRARDGELHLSTITVAEIEQGICKLRRAGGVERAARLTNGWIDCSKPLTIG